MATQLIHLPRHLVDAILISDLCDGWFAPNIGLEEVRPVQSETAVAVVVKGSTLGIDNWRVHGKTVFTLLLTSQLDPARDFLPHLLPDDLVAPVIEALISAASGSLCGHDVLELAGLLKDALDQPNALPLPPLCRRPRTRYERRLRQSALLLQRRFAPALDELQDEIAAYGDAVLRSGLGSIIGKRSEDAARMECLQLKPSAQEGCFEPRRSDGEAIASLLRERQQASAIRYVTEGMLAEMAPYGACRRHDLSAFSITRLHRHAFADFEPDRDAPLWRRKDPNYSEFPIAVPAVGIERAMLRFAAAFDQRLLADIDPLIKAILSWHHLLRIQPFGRSDRDVAEVLLHVLLRQAGLPPMPLPIIMRRRYWEHAHMLQIALEQNQCDCLVVEMLPAMREALELGNEMMDRLGAVREDLLDGLAENEASPVDSVAVVDELLSSVMVPQLIGRDLDETARWAYAFDHLHSKGLIDKIEIGEKVWWSLGAARNPVGQ